MRELTAREMDQVQGGLGLEAAGLAIIGLGFLTPVTAGFGLAIGGSLLYLHVVQGG